MCATYSFKEITSIWVCVEYFIAFCSGCNLSYNIFPDSIIDGYWANLKFQKIVNESSSIIRIKSKEEAAYFKFNFSMLLILVHPCNLNVMKFKVDVHDQSRMCTKIS